jgi:CheY-like chemotaxis protein
MTRPADLRFPDLSDRTILIIDDDLDALEIFARYLQACGAQVLVAGSAVSGLAYLDTTPGIDVVVTDLAMPDMDGVALARRVRGHPTQKKLPIISVTAFPERYPRSIDFDGWLRKPVLLEELAALVRSLTEQRDGRDR